MCHQLVESILIIHIHLVNKIPVTEISRDARDVVAVIKVHIEIQKGRPLNILIIILEVEPDDSFFGVSFLAPFFLGALVDIVPKLVTVVILDVRLVFVSPLGVGK
jgi:hypothetical protein